MSFIKSINQTLILALALVALLGYQFMSAQIWTAPAGSPPANNVQAPINIGTSTQSRQQGSGALVFNRFAAVNAVWSNQYCDAVGGNCFSPSAVNGSGGATGPLVPTAWGVVRSGVVYNGSGVQSVVRSGSAWIVTLSNAPTGDTNYIITPEVSSNDQAAVDVLSNNSFRVQARTSNFNPFLAGYFSFIVWAPSPSPSPTPAYVPVRVTSTAGNCPTNYDQIYENPGLYCTASSKSGSVVTCSISSPACAMTLARP